MLSKLAFSGNAYIGVFCAANNALLAISPQVPRAAVRKAERTLGVPSVRLTLGGSTVIGSLLVMNSHGALVSTFARPEEVAALEAVDVYSLNHPLNALGNNVLVNDHGGICHPGYGRSVIREMESIFDVPIEPTTLGGMRTVGSAGVATNRGAICHPHATEAELQVVEAVLGVKPLISTANYGAPQLGACVVANERGALLGELTTPIEVGRIEEGLRLY